MSKTIKQIAIVAVISFGSMYLISSFIATSFDITKWDTIGRAMCMGFALFITALFAGAIID